MTGREILDILNIIGMNMYLARHVIKSMCHLVSHNMKYIAVWKLIISDIT